MRRQQRGFTLIELMITIAIVGILCAVALPTFLTVMSKSKKVEATLAIDVMMRNVRVFHAENSSLPQSTTVMPGMTACLSPTGKTPSTIASQWSSDPGWKELAFHTDEPGYFQYEWANTTGTDGVAKATGDLECDGTLELLVIDVSILTGGVVETVTTDIN